MWGLGQRANADGEGTDGEDNFDDESGSGSGFRGGDHGGMTGDSGEDSGSGQEDLEDPQAEGSSALAMQFYPIDLGEHDAMNIGSDISELAR